MLALSGRPDPITKVAERVLPVQLIQTSTAQELFAIF